MFKELVLLCFDEDYAATQDIRFAAGPLFDAHGAARNGRRTSGRRACSHYCSVDYSGSGSQILDSRYPSHGSAGLCDGTVEWLAGGRHQCVFSKASQRTNDCNWSLPGCFSSVCCAERHGVLPKVVRQRRLNREVDRQHLLRGIYELLESRGAHVEVSRGNQTEHVSFDRLLRMRSWSPGRLRRQLARSRAEGHVAGSGHQIALTVPGFVEAARLVHEHRLWSCI